MNFQNIISNNFERLLLFLIKAAKYELEQQGHRLTGNLEKSLQYTIEGDLNKLVGKIWVADYGVVIDKGVARSRIPYNQGSGARTSMYIDGLKKFFRLRGLGAKEAERAAFATAKKQKKEGMPTRGSYAFSNNGKRLNWSRQVGTAENINESLKLLNLAFVMQTIVSNAIGVQNVTVNNGG